MWYLVWRIKSRINKEVTNKKYCIVLQSVHFPLITLVYWKFNLTFSKELIGISSLQQVLILKSSFQKNKVATGKTAFFLISPFCNAHSICHNIGFWEGSFVWICYAFICCTFNYNWYFRFVKKVFVFRKICFKVCFKIWYDNIKKCQCQKCLVLFFRRTYPVSVGFKMNPLRESVFLVFR